MVCMQTVLDPHHSLTPISESAVKWPKIHCRTRKQQLPQAVLWTSVNRSLAVDFSNTSYLKPHLSRCCCKLLCKHPSPDLHKGSPYALGALKTVSSYCHWNHLPCYLLFPWSKYNKRRLLRWAVMASLETPLIPTPLALPLFSLGINDWATKLTSFPLPVNKVKVPSETHIRSPFLQWRAPCNVFNSLCEPSVSWCAVVRSVASGETAPAFQKTSCRKAITFCVMPPGSCLRILDFCQCQMISPAPKMCCLIGEVLALPERKKEWDY